METWVTLHRSRYSNLKLRCQQVYYIKIYIFNYVVNANAILEWYIVVKRLDVTCTVSSKEISRTKGNKEKKVALYGHLIDRSALENNSFFPLPDSSATLCNLSRIATVVLRLKLHSQLKVYDHCTGIFIFTGLM